MNCIIVYYYAVFRDILRNLFLYFKIRFKYTSFKFLRNSSITNIEYDLGLFYSLLKNKPWLGFNNLYDYVTYKNCKKLNFSLIDGKILLKSQEDYYLYRHNKLFFLLNKYFNFEDSVIELGCGFGYNLFSLSLHNNNNSSLFYGFDFSLNGLSAANDIKKFYAIENVFFDTLDLSLTFTHKKSFFQNKQIFTYYCLEQLNNNIDHVIDNLILCNPKLVIHIEPTREIYRTNNLLDLNSYLYSLAMDYPNRILDCLRHREKLGLLKILEVSVQKYAPTVRNFPVFIAWCPVKLS